MGFLERLRKLLGLKAADFSATFPRDLETTTRGTLQIKRSELRVAGQAAVVFCRYQTNEGKGELGASFHPELSKPPDPKMWTEIFDRRYAEALGRWPDLLLAQSRRMAKELDFWLKPPSTVEDLVRSLELRRILVGKNETVTLRFATSPALRHHDLSVELTRDNDIVDVKVEG